MLVFGSHGWQLDKVCAADVDPRYVFAAGNDRNSKPGGFHCAAQCCGAFKMPNTKQMLHIKQNLGIRCGSGALIYHPPEG